MSSWNIFFKYLNNPKDLPKMKLFFNVHSECKQQRSQNLNFNSKINFEDPNNNIKETIIRILEKTCIFISQSSLIINGFEMAFFSGLNHNKQL